jgi:hypothetical protein
MRGGCLSILCEQVVLATVPRFRRAEALKCWTSKEAYLKGADSGFSLPVQEFDVSVEPDAPVELLRPHPALGSDVPWTLRGLPMERGYTAVIAAAGVPTCVCAYAAPTLNRHNGESAQWNRVPWAG